MRRHAVAEFQSRQRRCTEAARHTAVHHRHCRVDGWHQPQNTEQAQPRWAETLSVQRKHGYCEEDSGHNGPGTDIATDAEPSAQTSGPRTGWRPEADSRLECAASAGDQVVAGISAAICLDLDGQTGESSAAWTAARVTSSSARSVPRDSSSMALR